MARKLHGNVHKDVMNSHFLSDDDRQIIIEKLAALEHDQWIHYSKDISEQIRRASSLTELRKTITEKWSHKWIPYSSLSEKDKKLDRVWARKALQLFCSEHLE